VRVKGDYKHTLTGPREVCKCAVLEASQVLSILDGRHVAWPTRNKNLRAGQDKQKFIEGCVWEGIVFWRKSTRKDGRTVLYGATCITYEYRHPCTCSLVTTSKKQDNKLRREVSYMYLLVPITDGENFRFC